MSPVTHSETVRQDSASARDFRHEALLYEGEDDFVRQVGSFCRDGVRAGEPTLVVVGAKKIDLLREELGEDADEVVFADMADVGSNPARIIPAWRDFVDAHSGGGTHFRGVGEPIWAERTSDQLVECQRHEALLNLAFEDSLDWWLICPYDTTTLEPAVIDEVFRTHPFVTEEGSSNESSIYSGLEEIARPFDAPLPPPKDPVTHIGLSAQSALEEIREKVGNAAADHGLSQGRTHDLVLAVHELVTNTIRHGGGHGTLSIWKDGDVLICQVVNGGRIDNPLIGRERPDTQTTGGFGHWLVNHLCDLVQIRAFPEGSVVRLHMSR